MKKFFYTLVACVALLALLTGCTTTPGPTEPAGTTESPTSGFTPSTPPVLSDSEKEELLKGIRVPTNDPTYFDLLCENCDITVYLQASGSDGWEFWLISAERVDGEIITVQTDTGIAFQTPLPTSGQETPTKTPFETFLAYQGLSANKLTEEEYRHYQTVYALLSPDLPRLYTYRLRITFEMLGIDREETKEPVIIQTLTVTLKGQTKTYNVGNIQFLPDAIDLRYDDGLQYFFGVGGSLPRDYQKDGWVELHKVVDITVTKDVVLQRIAVTGIENVEVEVEFVVHPEVGGMFNVTWDGSSPLELDENSTVEMKLKFKDPAFGRQLFTNAYRYIGLYYTSDGVEYSKQNQLAYFTSNIVHGAYALKVDGVDVLEFQ